MSFLDTGFGGTNPLGGTSFGPTGALPGGGAPSGFGGGMNKLTGSQAPGTISPFDQQAVGNALNINETRQANQYAQLGLSAHGATPTSPGGPPGGVGVGGGANWQSANPSNMPTAEQMDLGFLPSLTGGLPGEAEAVLGMIQNANLQQPQQSGGGKGGGGKGGGIGSALGPLMMMGGK